MRNSNPLRRRSLMPALALALCSTGCSTNELQLESMEVTLSPEHFDSAGTGESSACLGFHDLVDSEGGYEVRLDGRELRSDESEVFRTHAGFGSTHFCVQPGDYNLSLVHSGKTVAQTGTRSYRGGSQHMFIVHGRRLEPTLLAAEIDMSPASPDFERRRVRITNLAEDKRPIQLRYFDQQEQEVGRSEVIAYGDTWTGSLPASFEFWTLTDDQARKGLIYPSSGSTRRWDHSCREVPPAGLIVIASQPDPNQWSPVPALSELYLQPPTSCS